MSDTSPCWCLDSSFFINGWNKYWHPEVFPSLWERIDALIGRKQVFSCDEVYRELKGQRDGLSDWAKGRRAIFQRPKEQIVILQKEVIRQFRGYGAGGLQEKADPWVVAHAISNRWTVVTDEQNQPRRATTPPAMPVVCSEFGVPCRNPIQFLKDAGIRL